MTTLFLFAALEPTDNQTDVYLTNTIQIDFESPTDFQNQINNIEIYLRGKAGNPSNYQFKSSDEFDNRSDCNKERSIKIKEYKKNGLNVQEITYLNKADKIGLKFTSATDFHSTTIKLPHLMIMRLTFGFYATYENIILVYDFNGNLIRNANNYFGDNSPLLIQQNISGHELYYTVASQHKNTPPDADEPFHPSWGIVLNESESEIIIGWKDIPQNQSYGNAIVTAFIF
jgi:hypothetical protein